MSKYSCEIIQDLLALYHDGICSEDSRKVVEQHLTECNKCRETIRSLGNTELDNKIAEQTTSVVNNHRKKQRRKIIIIISAAIIILAAVLFFGVIRPRMELNALVSEYLPEVGNGSEYFTEYSISDDSLISLNTDCFTINIPANYVQKDIGELDAIMYHDADNENRSAIIMTSDNDLSSMNIFDRAHFEDLTDEEYENIVRYLKDWFGALGNGLPDSAYGTYKCAYLLSDDDRSFWNIGQNIAFGITGIIKESLPIMGDEVFIYEADGKCGFITISSPKEGQNYFRVTADIYSTTDLNTPHTITIRSETLEEAYAMINSIKFK